MNSYEVLLCANQAFFYDVTLIQRIDDIPAGMLETAREEARSNITRLFSSVTPDASDGVVDLNMPIIAGKDNSWEIAEGVCLRVSSPVGSGLSEVLVVSEFALDKWYVRGVEVVKGGEEVKKEVVEVMEEGVLEKVKEEEEVGDETEEEEQKEEDETEEEEEDDDKTEEEQQEQQEQQEEVTPKDINIMQEFANIMNEKDEDDDTYSYYDYSCSEYYSDVSEDANDNPVVPSPQPTETTSIPVDPQPTETNSIPVDPQPTETTSIPVDPQAIDNLFKVESKPTSTKPPEIGSSIEECVVEEEEEMECEKSNPHALDGIPFSPNMENYSLPPIDTDMNFRIIYHGEEDESIRDHIAELAIHVGLEYAISIMDGGRNIRESIEVTRKENGNDDIEMLPGDENELEETRNIYDMGCAKEE